MHLPLSSQLRSYSDVSRRPRSLPLLMILVVPFTLQIITTVSVVGLLSLHNHQAVVQDAGQCAPIIVNPLTQRHFAVTLSLCLFSLGMTIAIAAYLNRKLARPILQLSEASCKLAHGEPCASIDVGRVKELAILTCAFNQMAQEIQQSRQVLEQYSESLAQEVYERTQALEQEVRRRTAIESVLHKANQELERLAFIDGLTQVVNRRHFDNQLEVEWRRFRRLQAPLALIMCDIDSFKQYNDTYGHQAGDDCLCQIASLLQATVKCPTDIVARYGGEEFAIILPNTSATGAIEVARKIQAAVRRLQLPHRSSTVSAWVTLSLGIASLLPSRGGMTPAQLIASADRALYEAKSKGRNCCTIAMQQLDQQLDHSQSFDLMSKFESAK